MDTVSRYNSFAIILHWVMAIAFFMMLGSGIVMTYGDFDPSTKFQLYQWHKSGGVILLLAFFLRYGWRIFTKIPSLPQNFARWEIKAAKIGHWGTYALMLALPLSGWVMVSASVYGLPTIVFNLFEWPHIQGVQGNETVENYAKTAHFILAMLFAAMIAIHIAAVVKHAVKDQENLLHRMWWSKQRKTPPIMKLFLLVFILLMPFPTFAGTDDIDYGQSSIAFSGTHVGNEFSGVFKDWTAEIIFDENDLENSRFSARFNTDSAVTNDRMYDGTLPQADWFDVKNHPEALFESNSITTNEDGSFKVKGSLTIRSITRPIMFDFTLTPHENGRKATASFTIDRLDYDIGKKSDEKAEWVSREIALTLNLIASKVTESQNHE